METAAGAIKALFVVMIINKLVLQGAVILGPSDPYIRLVNRHLAFLLHGICYHDGVMLRTFHEVCGIPLALSRSVHRDVLSTRSRILSTG